MSFLNNSTKIKFDKKTFNIKPYSNGAIFMWEEETGKKISESSTTKDNIMYIYCLFKACNRDSFNYSFEEFYEKLDDEPKVLASVYDFLQKKKI